ncbi:hypothetical protein ACSNOH_04280 [Streptomyces sp. URMC 127]|uniref:hypothetical protein n=1 Tax=Streptomyces sp. URMC 127 TaxID=3423402 RepID=UPI003F1C644F
MRRIAVAVSTALLGLSLAGLTGPAVAAPASVTANQCMLGGGQVVVVSPTLKICSGGIFNGQIVKG